MRVSVPTIPSALLSTAKSSHILSHSEAIERVASFLTAGNVTLLTGAGVSVDSGIRAYRGEDGKYLNANYKCVSYPCFLSACNGDEGLYLYVIPFPVHPLDLVHNWYSITNSQMKQELVLLSGMYIVP
jgi:hypothetical protein